MHSTQLCVLLIVAATAVVAKTSALPSEWGSLDRSEDPATVVELLQADEFAPPAKQTAGKGANTKAAPAAGKKAVKAGAKKAKAGTKKGGAAMKSGAKKKKMKVPMKFPAQSGPEQRVEGGVKYKAVLFNAQIFSGAEEKMFYKGTKPKALAGTAKKKPGKPASKKSADSKASKKPAASKASQKSASKRAPSAKPAQPVQKKQAAKQFALGEQKGQQKQVDTKAGGSKSKKTDGEKADGKKAGGSKSKKADGKKADGEKADGEKADGKKEGGSKSKKAGTSKKTDGNKGKGQAPGGQVAPTKAAPKCCNKITVKCLACKQGMTVKKYCANSPKTPGCVILPKDPTNVSLFDLVPVYKGIMADPVRRESIVSNCVSSMKLWVTHRICKDDKPAKPIPKSKKALTFPKAKPATKAKAKGDKKGKMKKETAPKKTAPKGSKKSGKKAASKPAAKAAPKGARGPKGPKAAAQAPAAPATAAAAAKAPDSKKKRAAGSTKPGKAKSVPLSGPDIAKKKIKVKGPKSCRKWSLNRMSDAMVSLWQNAQKLFCKVNKNCDASMCYNGPGPNGAKFHKLKAVPLNVLHKNKLVRVVHNMDIQLEKLTLCEKLDAELQSKKLTQPTQCYTARRCKILKVSYSGCYDGTTRKDPMGCPDDPQFLASMKEAQMQTAMTLCNHGVQGPAA